MVKLTFPDLTPSDAHALLTAYEEISAADPVVEATAEDIIRWLLESPTANQVAWLKIIASAAPAWVTAIEIGDAMGLGSAALGGASARIHSRVTFRYGDNFPWEREEKGDVVRYRMTAEIAAVVLEVITHMND